MENEFEERSSLESILDYVQILWRWAWLLLLVAIMSGGAAYYLTNQQPRVYQSSTRAMVNVISSSQYYDSYTASYAAERLAETYAQTMITSVLRQNVEALLGYQVTGAIKAQAVTGSPLITITVTDTNPQQAADVANAVVTVFSQKITTDQSSRYTELKTSLEEEIARIDSELTSVNEKLAVLQIKTAEIEAAQELADQMDAAGLEPIKVETDPADYVTRAQLEFAKSQYQSTRSSLFYNLQQIRLSEAQSATTISQIEQAVANPNPVQPQPLRSAGLAAVVGLMIAAGFVFLIAFLEDTVRNPEEITRRWNVPVLGMISEHNTTQNPIITQSQPRAPVSEAFRSLRTNLQFAGINNPLHTILITSASPQDGKTTVVSNLASVLAQNDRDVLVIDGDLRRPRIHRILELSNRVGLSDYFIRTQDRLNGMVKKTKIQGLCAITSGSLPPNPSELLNSEKMMEVIQLLSRHFNTLIIDTPPLLAVTDALVLAPRVDGVILVMDPGRTKRVAIKRAIEQLRQVNANLLGVVFNKVKHKRSEYYYYERRYGKTTDEGAAEPTQSRDDADTAKTEAANKA